MLTETRPTNVGPDSAVDRPHMRPPAPATLEIKRLSALKLGPEPGSWPAGCSALSGREPIDRVIESLDDAWHLGQDLVDQLFE